MRRMVAMAMGGLLSLCVAATVGAAPQGAPNGPQSKGIANAKKAMRGKLERDRKVQEVRKQGQAMKKRGR